MTVELFIHIVAGTLGLISGFIALASSKGSGLHRLAGKVYFQTMIIMSLTGMNMALRSMIFITVLASALTIYLVYTSWLAVKIAYFKSLAFKVSSFVMGACVSFFGMCLSLRAYYGTTDMIHSFAVPAEVYYLFTGLALIATTADLVFIFQKKRQYKRRMLRHVWRMCVPLYIASSSFFVGQEQLFPDWLQGSYLLQIPQFTAILLMLYWVARIHIYKGIK